jgi:hypothetical protein
VLITAIASSIIGVLVMLPYVEKLLSP